MRKARAMRKARMSKTVRQSVKPVRSVKSVKSVKSSKPAKKTAKAKKVSEKTRKGRVYQSRTKRSHCRGVKRVACSYDDGCRFAEGPKRRYCRKSENEKVPRVSAKGGAPPRLTAAVAQKWMMNYRQGRITPLFPGGGLPLNPEEVYTELSNRFGGLEDPRHLSHPRPHRLDRFHRHRY